jgi:nucleoside-diphosphate-sugar epimerase
LILEAYARLHGFELIVLRPANVFGFGHFWSGSGGGKKMQDLLEAGLSGKTARIEQSQTMANEYIYARDMGRAIDLAATVTMPKQATFNIGNGVVTPFDEVLAGVKSLFPSLRYEIAPGEAPQSKSAPLDISAAKEHLGWEPRFSVQSAFADFLTELKAARR